MITRGDLYPARFAIACYQRQNYRNRELVIVCEQRNSALANWVATQDEPSIRLFETDPAPIGALRNLSIAMAEGDLLCQWDDDDLCHPTRLFVQYSHLVRSGTGAHFMSQWMMWWPARRTMCISQNRLWEGSILVRRELAPTYPEIEQGEDTEAILALLAHHKAAISSKPSLYCYVIHGRNTCSQEHFERMFERAQATFSAVEYDTRLERMARTMPIREYGAWLESGRADTFAGFEADGRQVRD